MINEFKGEHFFLSNFYESPVWHNGLTYPTVENYFQACKTFDGPAREAIARSSPQIAKHIGRNLKIVDFWDKVRVQVMKEGIEKKFKDPDLRGKLVETAPHLLVEGNYWHDQFWGSCYCEKHKDKPGQNVLGILLMAERALHL